MKSIKDLQICKTHIMRSYVLHVKSENVFIWKKRKNLSRIMRIMKKKINISKNMKEKVTIIKNEIQI